MKRVITYGTFDLLHIGHLNLLERLRRLGGELIVGVSTDEFNEKKGKRCVVSFADRIRLVSALKCVDVTIPEYDWAQKVNDIKALDVHLFAMGDDWMGKFDHLRSVCDVMYLPRTEGVSTTFIRETISGRIGSVAVGGSDLQDVSNQPSDATAC